MSEKQMRLGALEAGGTKMVCAVVSGDGEVLVVDGLGNLGDQRADRKSVV